MRVLVQQQFHPGHFYQWAALLMPMLLDSAGDCVVAVTPEGVRSPEFDVWLKPYADRVRFEQVLQPADPALPFRERVRVHRGLRDAIRRISPDYVLIPSGDAETTAMSFFRLTGRGCVPGRIPCEVGIHYGSGRRRDWVHTLNFALSGVRRIHIVNHLYYEQLKSLGRIGRRFTLLPSPVVRHAMDRTEARRRLGIPETGKYIGLAASFDLRKAVGEFLAAFRAASNDPNERVLLAGWLNPVHASRITNEFHDLVSSGKVIVKSGFLEPDAFRAAVCALDVVCAPYPGFQGLSNTVLEAAAARRPVLCDDSGWSRAIVRRFGLGWTCRVRDHADFTAAVRRALDQSGEHEETEPIRRLMAFHSPDNFGRTWVEGVRKARGATPVPPLSWDWVTEALPAGRGGSLTEALAK